MLQGCFTGDVAVEQGRAAKHPPAVTPGVEAPSTGVVVEGVRLRQRFQAPGSQSVCNPLLVREV